MWRQSTCSHTAGKVCVCTVCVCVYTVRVLTLQWQDVFAVDHDAELQDKLWCALQESLQQPQHVDISRLKHQAPVAVAIPVVLHTQVQHVNVPTHTHIHTLFFHFCLYGTINTKGGFTEIRI